MKFAGLLSVLLLASSSRAATTWPEASWPTAAPADEGLHLEKLLSARDYALTGEGSGYVIYHGKLVLTWGDPKMLYDLKSSTKSFGSAALGLAIKDGKLKLEDKAKKFHPQLGTSPPENLENGWLDQITILHLASQTAGFEKPGGFTRLLFQPGTIWDYSDSGPNWLAECLTLVYQRDLDEFMFERLFGPIGIQRSDLVWRKNAYRPEFIEGTKRREFGAGISANVDAMARFGYLHLRNGIWNGKEILSSNYIAIATRPLPSSTNLTVLHPDDYSNASQHYGLLWWNNGDGTLKNVPRDAYWSWGLYDSIILVVPSLDLVVARAGKSWQRSPNAHHYDVLRPFFEPLGASIQSNTTQPDRRIPAKAPYPPSDLVKQITWAPKEQIFQAAKGSDNWPMTWADDDALYTAYGDGQGFEPFVPEKLSVGLAKILGTPPTIQGLNIDSTIQEKGDGPRGRKTSGILAIDNVLYLWLRNASNSLLVWSSDHGRTWTKSDWRFTNSFGCPTFLNFGKNYAGARDNFVYVYSFDSDNAYQPADRMVLARVPKTEITRRSSYEFFSHLDNAGQPVWTQALEKRGAVFENPSRCYRSGISFNAPLKRYFWCQIIPGRDTRFSGGFGIYEAREPWGPWRTAYFTEEWDVGPGESCSFPTKWISPDGKQMYLVFSGDDSFSVRKAILSLR